MIVRKFICKEHPEAGFKGWRPGWMPHFDPMEGLGVAHDTLEHAPRDDGSVEAEFRAFGTMMWLRGGSSWFAQNGSYETDPAVHMGREFREQAEYLAGEGRRLRAAPRTYRLAEDWAEEAIERCIHEGMKTVREECSAETGRLLDRNHIRSYLRIGYRYAARRYADPGCHNMGALFNWVMQEANRKLKHAELNDELIVRVDLAHRRVRVETVERDY